MIKRTHHTTGYFRTHHSSSAGLVWSKCGIFFV